MPFARLLVQLESKVPFYDVAVHLVVHYFMENYRKNLSRYIDIFAEITEIRHPQTSSVNLNAYGNNNIFIF